MVGLCEFDCCCVCFAFELRQRKDHAAERLFERLRGSGASSLRAIGSRKGCWICGWEMDGRNGADNLSFNSLVHLTLFVFYRSFSFEPGQGKNGGKRKNIVSECNSADWTEGQKRAGF